MPKYILKIAGNCCHIHQCTDEQLLWYLGLASLKEKGAEIPYYSDFYNIDPGCCLFCYGSSPNKLSSANKGRSSLTDVFSHESKRFPPRTARFICNWSYFHSCTETVDLDLLLWVPIWDLKHLSMLLCCIELNCKKTTIFYFLLKNCFHFSLTFFVSVASWYWSVLFW